MVTPKLYKAICYVTSKRSIYDCSIQFSQFRRLLLEIKCCMNSSRLIGSKPLTLLTLNAIYLGGAVGGEYPT